MFRQVILVLSFVLPSFAEPSLDFNYLKLKDVVNNEPVSFMDPKKSAHVKDDLKAEDTKSSWPPLDFNKFDAQSQLDKYNEDDARDQNRIKRSAEVPDDAYDVPVNLMGPKKNAHVKEDPNKVETKNSGQDPWAPFDFSKFDEYLNRYKEDDERDYNRVKRRAKRRRGRGGRRRNRNKSGTDDNHEKNKTIPNVPIARAGADGDDIRGRMRSGKRGDKISKNDVYETKMSTFESDFVEMPKDLYQAHLRPGVIFRIHLAEAIIKMQYRNYGEDKDESVIDADVEYLRLTRKVINDEITKFEDLKWLVGWFNNRSTLVQGHMCNTRYFAVGIPPTMFTHSEEYMKRMCLFDNVYIDHIPYVVGDDSSLMAAVAPPVLHCDAATCTSVPFIDSLMFDERLPRTNVRTVTRCQASCRAHCRNDPDCLKRCSERCLRAE